MGEAPMDDAIYSERRESDRRLLDQMVRQHEKVHEDEKEHSRLIDEDHWRQHGNEHSIDQLWRGTHADKHKSDDEAVRVAIDAERHRLEAHREAHASAHAAHEELHDAFEKAHDAMHSAEAEARLAAITSMDKRLDGMNQFREQMREQAASFVLQASFDAFKDERRAALQAVDAQVDRRFEELRNLIATEREERREQFGVRKGATASLGWIIAAIGLAGTLLGILVAVMALISI